VRGVRRGEELEWWSGWMLGEREMKGCKGVGRGGVWGCMGVWVG